MKYDIFISYRRSGGSDTAQTIKMALERRGYSVFLDVEALRSSGPFNTQLYKRIEESSYFIAILSPGSLERCFKKEDWVCNEIRHAFQHNKVVIPVMLRNFIWLKDIPVLDDNSVSQEEAEEIRELLQKLSLQNGLAPSMEHFDASMDKLAGLMPINSTKKFIRKTVSSAWVLLLTIILALGLIGGKYYFARKAFETAANTTACLMAVSIGEMDVALSGVIATHEEWEKFLDQWETKPRDREENLKRFLDFVENKRTFFEKKIASTPPDELPKEVKLVLQKNNVDLAETEAFYKMHIPSRRDLIRDYYDSMKMYAELLRDSAEPDNILDGPSMRLLIKDRAKANKEMAEDMTWVTWYGYLTLLAKLPDSVYEHAGEALHKLTNLRGPMKQSVEDLTLQMNQRMNQSEENWLKIENSLTVLDAYTDKEAARLDRIEQKQKEVAQLESKVDQMTSALEKQLDELFTQFAFSPEDSLGLSWGKILRLSTVLRQQSILASPYTPKTLTALEEQLTLWEEHWKKTDPHAEPMAKAARHYFRLLAKGEVQDTGIIAYMIENDAEHPNLRPGDILLKTDDKKLTCLEDLDIYMKKDPTSTRTRLRFTEDGKPLIEVYHFQPDTPRVAWMSLNE